MTFAKQRGLALMMVLLIFAIVSVLAIQMLNRQTSNIDRTANMLSLQQARAYAFGVEAVARSGLFLDWKLNKNLDHLQEKWNKPFVFPLEPGTARIKIQDPQGRFNLNSLMPQSNHHALQKKRFKKLLNLLGLPTNYADLWSRWLNKASQEDDRYTSKQPSYKAGYQACQHASELLLLEDFSDKQFRLLQPYVTCLPYDVPLNINTASDYVLASLSPSYSLADGKDMIRQRGKKGFRSIDDFWQLAIVQKQLQPLKKKSDKTDSKVFVDKWEKTDFSTYTEYFEVFANIKFADRTATSESVIKRQHKDGKMYTIRRDYSRSQAKREVTEAYSETKK